MLFPALIIPPKGPRDFIALNNFETTYGSSMLLIFMFSLVNVFLVKMCNRAYDPGWFTACFTDPQMCYSVCGSKLARSSPSR